MQLGLFGFARFPCHSDPPNSFWLRLKEDTSLSNIPAAQRTSVDLRTTTIDPIAGHFWYWVRRSLQMATWTLSDAIIGLDSRCIKKRSAAEELPMLLVSHDNLACHINISLRESNPQQTLALQLNQHWAWSKSHMWIPSPSPTFWTSGYRMSHIDTNTHNQFVNKDRGEILQMGRAKGEKGDHYF